MNYEPLDQSAAGVLHQKQPGTLSTVLLACVSAKSEDCYSKGDHSPTVSSQGASHIEKMACTCTYLVILLYVILHHVLHEVL